MNKTVGLLLAAALAAAACNPVASVRGKADEVRAKLRGTSGSDPVTVKVMSVRSGEGGGAICYVGSAKSSRVGTVNASAPGVLAELNVRKGMKVGEGQVLGRIESQSAKSALEVASAKLSQAEDGYARLKKVYDKGGVPEVKMVEMQTALTQARALEETARKSLDDCTLKAPFAGVVDELFCQQGENVTLSLPVLRITDVSNLEISFSVPESELEGIAEGDAVRVDIPAINVSGQAKLLRKGIAASTLSHSCECTAGLPAGSGKLLPGMVCKVWVQRSGRGAAVIPATCVMTDAGGRYVWTVKDGVVGKNYIIVEGYSGDGIIVGDGIGEGELVVIEGRRKISTGMTVKTVQ